MLYLDTSLLVTLLTNERETNAVQDWLGDRAGQSLGVSDWTISEFSAALSIKLRRKEIDLAGRMAALHKFAGLRSTSITTFAVSRADFTSAARLADNHDQGLRAGDALHLAITIDRGATLCTRDRDQAAAAAAIGAAHQFI